MLARPEIFDAQKENEVTAITLVMRSML